MLRITFLFFILFFNSSHSHDLDTEFFEIQSKIKNNLIASSHKKKIKIKSTKEREKKMGMKRVQKWIEFKYPNLQTDCFECKNLDGFVPPNTIDLEIFRMAGIIPGKPTSTDVKIQKKRGMIKIGMKPKFHENGKCKTCDDCWAINYSHKRDGLPALHKGRDLPMPFDTPVLAMADGTVVGLFKNEKSRKGIEVVLRHAPKQTNLPFFTYTQYTHFNKWPLDLKIGQKVKVGDILGPNGNSGKKGKNIRRPALHFAVFKSKSPEWSSFERGFLVKDGYWMDPVTFFKKKPPFDHRELKKLNKKEKKIFVGYKTNNGEFIPNNTKKIWPFSCKPGDIVKKNINLRKDYIENLAKMNLQNLKNIKQ
tara:strand:- start:190 stop:1281 length:1092 start_codon:yes stop_codon:yes gene_type:complete